MIITITLLVLFIITIIIGEATQRSYGWRIIPGMLTILIGVLFAISFIGVASKTVSFNRWVAQRDAFEYTLTQSRASGNTHESAAIVSKVAEWNERLASSRVDKAHWLWGQYVDDRIHTLEFIK